MLSDDVKLNCNESLELCWPLSEPKIFKMCALHHLQQKAVFIRSKNQMFNELYSTLCVNWLLNRFQIVIMTVILLEFSWLCC